MRQLATIQRVTNVQPIPNADAIEVCNIQGWECVIKKNEYKEGDLVVYIEIDSIVPAMNPYFDFMQERRYRVRTIKLRKQISQGLVCPLSILEFSLKNQILEKVIKGNKCLDDLKEGDDVTELLGVTKYDPQMQQEQELSIVKHNKFAKYFMRYRWFRWFIKRERYPWPSFIVHTDETRIQNIPRICDKYQGVCFTATEKLDGTSATYFLKRNKKRLFRKLSFEFGVCSRNLRLLRNKTGKNYYWEMVEKYNIETVLKQIIGNHQHVVLQGEIIGEGIQKNKYKIKGQEFYAFNLYIDGKKYDIHSFLPSFSLVPVVYDNLLLPELGIFEMIKLSRGRSVLYNRQREGIVVRNYELGVSFKVIDPIFLLDNQDEDEK